MVGKTDTNPSSMGFPFDLGRADAIVHWQKELLEAYEQTSRAWLARVQSEVAADNKTASARSVPEAMQAFQECISQCIQMAAEDSRRLSEDCQKMMQTITSSLSSGFPRGST